jgi:uncharacterized repeat protein (TIGR01451 family)
LNTKHALTALVLLVMLIGWGCGTPVAPAAPATSVAPTSSGALAEPAPSAAPVAAPQIGGCPVFPANNIWNIPIDTLPVDSNSDAYVNSIGSDTEFHPDFGSDPTYGIPYVVVPQGQPKVPITFEYDDESDPGPYPIPPNPPIEGGPDSDGDRHILVIEQGTCKLYETWSTYPNDDGSWSAGSGAIFDLRSNALRPDTWTSADAAGLPILPGLVRRDEVLAGEINHALRFTARETRRAYIWPARHFASDNTDPNVPPMGQRFRLKASFDISQFPQYDQVILTALKKYGMILADNGSDWFVSGATDPAWDDDALNLLKQLQGSDFEAVDVSSLQLDPDSAQVKTMSQKTVTPAAARQGQQVAYRIQIGGDGTPVTLNDPLPAEVTMVSNSLTTAPASAPQATFSGGAVAWNGQPAPGETVDISYSVTLSTATTQVIRNTATVSRGGGGQDLIAVLIANPRLNFLPLTRR